MTKPRTKWRGALRWLVWPIIAMVLAVVLLPVWFPWLARPVLGQFGLSYGAYERIGFTRFALNDLNGAWENADLKAARLECVLPTAWLWTRLFPDTSPRPGLILYDGLLTISAETNQPPVKAGETQSAFSTLDQIDRIAALLSRNLPAARLTNCTVVVPSARITLASAEWRSASLRASVRAEDVPGIIDLEAKFGSDRSMALSAAWDEQQAVLEGEFTRTKTNWNWTGELRWMTNRAGVSATFGTNGWWPETAQVKAPQVRLPAELVRLQGYEDLTVSVTMNVVSNQFSLEATGTARPTEAPESAGLPPVQAALRASGNPDSVTIEQLQLEAPWGEASLTNTLGIKRTGELLGKSAELQVTMDLSKLPGVSLKGNVIGRVNLEFPGTNAPVAIFNVTGTRVAGYDFEAESIALRGRFVWPLLTVDSLRLQFEDGSMASVDGSLHLSAKTLGDSNWKVSGKLLQRFLPGWTYRTLEASGRAQGPLSRLAHTGSISAEDLEGGKINPLAVKVAWQGEGLTLTSVNAEIAAAESTLSISGQLEAGAIAQQNVNATIERASLRRNGKTLYALQSPSRIAFSGTGTNKASGDWNLAVDTFDWRGEEKFLFLSNQTSWPGRGNVQLKAGAFALRDFTDFVQIGVSNISLPQLELNAQWSNGPVQMSSNFETSIGDLPTGNFTVRGKVESGDEIKIHELTVASEAAPALTITGTLPLQAVPSLGTNWLVMATNGSIALQASSKAVDDEFRLALGTLGRLQISQPQLQCAVSGTLDRPSASLKLGVARIQWRSGTNATPGPQIEQLKFDASVTPELIEAHELSAMIDGQPIVGSAKWPLPSGFWKKLWAEKKLPDWSDATGQLKVQDAQVKAFSHYLPDLLAPEGSLNLQLTLAEGRKLDGMLTLTNASTRPLGQLAPLRDIAAAVRFDGSQAILKDFHGQMGGQPLQASGKVEFPADGQLQYEVMLQGTNVPLARSLEFLLRGDLNVKLQGGGDLPPTLSGSVALHHGLFVRYASEMLWSSPKRAALRPPYFSVTNEPFADWKLDLRIEGDEFMRVRAPMFSGTLSTAMNLRGTLSEPALTGDARIKSGRILFPFGTLTVDEGYATLSGNDPRGPTLQLRASGRTLNYEVRLEVTGPVEGANVSFTSTPPLNSEEILLLLTAGELPEKEHTFTTEARAGRLVTFLGKDLWARASGSNPEEQRLTINSGESISEEGKLTYSVEYRLADRWFIIGEYDRFNAFNANLKWKILSR